MTISSSPRTPTVSPSHRPVVREELKLKIICPAKLPRSHALIGQPEMAEVLAPKTSLLPRFKRETNFYKCSIL
ncbi:hypothetical protein RRG08_054448 [Elysia crispata]|uniref:Uncharacterized protein n=1 Tax=Elysia crispata TaxID=231223 RepID=A0AAE1AW72_9GAST|nr:hypothetical protein RRG08_054448 [Elysia crispata]